MKKSYKSKDEYSKMGKGSKRERDYSSKNGKGYSEKGAGKRYADMSRSRKGY